MIIVKIGGSVFSDKGGEPENLDEKTVRQIARQVGEAYLRGEDFLIVHGGGSFGHPQARRYRIRDGLAECPEVKRIGFSETHRAMLRANDRIVKIFLDEGLPAFSVSTSSIFITRNGEVVHGDVEVIRKLIERRFIPVLFGDVSVDLAKGIDILSGDQIITYLARTLKPEKVIFLMDVDGIYDRNPREPGSRLLDELTGEEIEHLLESSEAAGVDVTGGIGNKLREALKIARYSEVWFVNGKVPERLLGAIKGGAIGTKIVWDPSR
ncbi:isopentenyl phosphate kinase [Palaeococcus ferrophilus]|uniref:isopentenyl phosphate kinase n=1 Tax=Palaeococcus ferrophilus TaxID=83868 RepID=UPI00064F0C57|nr:isopentenyl phosphate kinase [Palaeococcus ferrophilus]